MIYPKFIKENSVVGVPAPSNGAGSIDKQNRILNAKKRLENLNYEVILSKNIMKSDKKRSANYKVRAKEINDMFKNNNIDLLMCASGGEFLVEILPYIDFDIIKNNPKFITGFSDPTGLLYPITTKLDIATIYGTNFSSLGSEHLHRSEEDFLKLITGNLVEQTNYDMYENEYQERITGLEDYNLTDKVYWKTLDNKSVDIKGRIIGGCFDLISELAGTKYDGINEFNERYKDDGIIWYFDNCEISMEETIRTLWKMNELDYFKYTKCIIFGRFGTDHTCCDYDTKSCLKDSVISKLNIPIVYDADISHKGPCLNIINGSIANIKVKNGKSSISFELK